MATSPRANGVAPHVLDLGKSNATSFGLSQRAFNKMATPTGASQRARVRG